MATDTRNNGVGWNFDNSYARLPGSLFTRIAPVPVRTPELILLNFPLAAALGLDAEALQAGHEGADVFGGNRLPAGAQPLAQAYAGHQFGSFTMLGDGRAVLLGEQITPTGARFDIQLKGSGQTPYSRQGDGRSALGPVLREYIISEAMHALGIPTSRSLAVVTTGEPVYREAPLPGAVLTRVMSSHLRIGTFQYVAAFGTGEVLRALADYTLRRHFPEFAADEDRYLALLREVVGRQAALVARWQQVGFIHGVMNTDNMALCGETFDYGPCAFMDAYDPATVFSSIDLQGRYAFGNQPVIAGWNLARFAETLLPLLHPDPGRALTLAREAVGAYAGLHRRLWLAGMRSKLGLLNEETDDDSLVEDLLAVMRQQQADFTNTFRELATQRPKDAPLFQTPDYLAWHARWRARRARQDDPVAASRRVMREANPAVIPRNHQVEAALEAAVARGEYHPLTRLLGVLSRPYADTPDQAEYRLPPPPSDRAYRTFCGT
jgi:uncharacterized protein YdiU (UPF0061 family)